MQKKKAKAKNRTAKNYEVKGREGGKRRWREGRRWKEGWQGNVLNIQNFYFKKLEKDKSKPKEIEEIIKSRNK
jgi:Ni/Co efflux regulator RcnB